MATPQIRSAIPKSNPQFAMPSSVLITRRLPGAVVRRLEEQCDVDMHRGETPLAPEDLRARAADKDALIVLLPDRIDRAVLDAAPRLRIIANVAVGYDNLDVRHAAQKGVICTNTPDVLTEATADLAWALILDVTRRVTEGDRLARAGNWKGWTFEFMLGSGLQGKQLVIVGAGRIGRAVAERARAFGMTIAVTSRRDPGWPDAEFMPLDRLLATSDVVSLHVPLSPETRGLIDQPALARMKRTAFLINTTRGAVVDESALAWALKEHMIAGAGLDVFENEPQINAALLTLENVVLSPHLGSATRETRTAMADLAVSNVLAVLSGQPPLTPIAARI
jgi:lactate dehydrogenase-like 2-hydroxyacid dehydrogenase